MADSDEYEPCGTLVEFLQLKGSIGLIALLYERPRAYSELESEIEITSSTITRRRIDADHLGLLTVELESNDHGTKHVYTLTDLGNYVAERMANKGIVSTYYQMRDRQKEIEQKTEEIVKWVENNPTNFIKFEAALDERIAPREEDTGLPPELEEVRAAREESDDETGVSEEKSETGTDSEEMVTDDDSPDRARRSLDNKPLNMSTSSENETQGTFDDISPDDDPESVDEDSDA
jgi:DNA-binding HxlR family transcriptional regulator